METVRVQAGQTELIKNDRFIDSTHAGVIGLSAKVVIFRNTTPRFWNGSAYQSGTIDLSMTEMNSSDLPGHYVFSLNTTGMTEEEHFVIAKSGSTLNASVINDSQEGAIWIGGYIDNLDAAVSGVPTAVWAVGTRTLTSFGTLVADIATAVWSAVTRTLTTSVATSADVTAIQASIAAVFASAEVIRKIEHNRVEVTGSGPYTVDVYEDNGTTIAFTLQVSANFLSRTVI